MDYLRGTAAQAEPEIAPNLNLWNCLTLSDGCIITSDDPNTDTNINLRSLYIGILTICLGLIVMIGADMKFFWAIDCFQRQVDYYINLTTKKVRRVQSDQRKLMPTLVKSAKQLQKCQQCNRIISALRSALTSKDPQHLEGLVNYYLTESTQSPERWNETATPSEANTEAATEWLK